METTKLAIVDKAVYLLVELVPLVAVRRWWWTKIDQERSREAKLFSRWNGEPSEGVVGMAE